MATATHERVGSPLVRYPMTPQTTRIKRLMGYDPRPALPASGLLVIQDNRQDVDTLSKVRCESFVASRQKTGQKSLLAGTFSNFCRRI